MKIADECLEDMMEWLRAGGGQVGIYDGNNVTEERRREIFRKLQQNDIHPLFIESICEKPEIVLANIKSVKVSSPDVSLFIKGAFYVKKWEMFYVGNINL